jgi:hypothetical protein
MMFYVVWFVFLIWNRGIINMFVRRHSGEALGIIDLRATLELGHLASDSVRHGFYVRCKDPLVIFFHSVCQSTRVKMNWVVIFSFNYI